MRALWLSLILALPMAACGQSKSQDVLDSDNSNKATSESVVQAAADSAVNGDFDDYISEVSDYLAAPESYKQEFREIHKLSPPLTDKEVEDYSMFFYRISQSSVNVKQPFSLPSNAPIECSGVIEQGGAVLCRTFPNSKVKIGRTTEDYYYEKSNQYGELVVGFDRDEKNAIIQLVEIDGVRHVSNPIAYSFKPRSYDISRIDGLPPSQVSTFNEEQLKRIRSSSARKKIGFSSRARDVGFENGFIAPVKDYIKTTNFGAQRILNGEPKKPHMGVDMAAPVGTPIYAPADGIVSLADDDLYFEGAMVLLDHGQGLISMYLHVNEILVEPGQAVKQGEQIATIGSKGRSTGPHLCWRLKWRNRNLDPELLTKWPDN